MRDSGLRDSHARLRHWFWLETQLNLSVTINETQSAEKLEEFQGQENHFQTLSFQTISAFGSNGAIIHYGAEPSTAARITRENLYLLDAGAQYLDGSTDVTRTYVFGQPTDEQRRAYTAVLQGDLVLSCVVCSSISVVLKVRSIWPMPSFQSALTVDKSIF
jgi:Xaa-Pro aminopeptidase